MPAPEAAYQGGQAPPPGFPGQAPAPHAFRRSLADDDATTLGLAPPPRLLIPAGNLPQTFVNEGLPMLRQGQFDQAVAYYGELVKANPENAHAWFGLGAAMLGKRKEKDAVEYICHGLTLDKDFPVGELVEETRPGDPNYQFSLAKRFAARGDQQGFSAALGLLDTSLASPMTTERLYMKIDAYRRQCRELYDDYKNRDNPTYNRMKQRARVQQTLRGVVKVVFCLLLVGLVAGGGWWFYERVQADAIEKEGIETFARAARAASEGRADTQDLLCDAWLLLHRANSAGVNNIFPTLAELRCSESLLGYESAYHPKAGMPKKLKDLDKATKKLEARLKSMDATGILTRGAEDRLKKALEQGPGKS